MVLCNRRATKPVISRASLATGDKWFASLGPLTALPLCLAVCGLLGACREEAPPSLEASLLDLALEAGQPGDGLAAARLADLELRLGAALEHSGARHPLEALNSVVFGDLGYRRVVAGAGLRHALLPHVLASRRGSCLGLSGLYLVLGRRLGVPLRGVLVPGHFFVRHEGGRGAELLKRGRPMPHSWYVRRYGVPPGNPLYLRDLAPDESLAVFRYNLANHRRRRGDLPAALSLYREVVLRLPRFAEAQASLGLTLHLLGRAAPARAAYQRARAAHPGLPGLQQNLDALEAGLRTTGRAAQR